MQPDQSNVYRLTRYEFSIKLEKLKDNEAYFLEYSIDNDTFIVNVGNIVESEKYGNDFENKFDVETLDPGIGTYLGIKILDTNDIKVGDYFLRVEKNTMPEIKKKIPGETCAFAYRITDINKENATAKIQKFTNKTPETVTFPGFGPTTFIGKARQYITGTNKRLPSNGGKRNRNTLRTKKPKRKNRRKSRKN